VIAAASAGTDVLPMHELTADALADALRSCLDGSSYRDRAAELGHRIRAEDGPGAVLSLIGQFDVGGPSF
jgi:UDP:flavonoid glycosyltransferase YjiC (YdhE family)